MRSESTYPVQADGKLTRKFALPDSPSVISCWLYRRQSGLPRSYWRSPSSSVRSPCAASKLAVAERDTVAGVEIAFRRQSSAKTTSCINVKCTGIRSFQLFLRNGPAVHPGSAPGSAVVHVFASLF